MRAKRTLWQTILLLILCGLHALLVGSTILAEQPIIWPLHNDTIHRSGRAADFYAVYHAGHNIRHGLNPYDLAPDGITPYFYPFRYLPVVAQTTAPLTWFSPQHAYLIWVAIVELLLAALLVRLWQHIERPVPRWLTVSALLFSSPYLLELYMGQFTFAAIALVALAVLARRGFVFWLLSVLLKPIALVTIPAFWRQPGWRRPVLWLLALAALLTLPYFFHFPRQLGVFVRLSFMISGALDSGNYGFLYLFWLLVEDHQIGWIMGSWPLISGGFRLMMLGGAAGLVFLARERSLLVTVPLLLLAHFLSFQLVWEHHMSAAAVIAAVMLARSGLSQVETSIVLLSLLLLVLPTPFTLFDTAKDPAFWDPTIGWPRYAEMLVILPKVAPTLLLFWVAARHLTASGLLKPAAAWRELRQLPTARPAVRTEPGPETQPHP